MRPLKKGSLPQGYQVRSQTVFATRLRLGLDTCENVEHHACLELRSKRPSLSDLDAPSDWTYPSIMHLPSFRGITVTNGRTTVEDQSSADSRPAVVMRLPVEGRQTARAPLRFTTGF